MEPKFQSSFIPKGPVATSGMPTSLSRSSQRTLLGTLAVFVFSFSILMSLGVYGYQLFLKSHINSLAGDLAAARQSLQPDTIQKISDLDGRLVSTKTLLSNHIVLSPLFDYLESSTVKDLRFSDFGYVTDDKGINLTMRGVARGYSAIALQSQIFNQKGSPFKNVVFSDLLLDEKGDVTFTFKATVDPSVVSYANEVNSQQSSVVPVPEMKLVPSAASTTASSTQ